VNEVGRRTNELLKPRTHTILSRLLLIAQYTTPLHLRGEEVKSWEKERARVGEKGREEGKRKGGSSWN
jgi:hypothetical protein